MRTVMKIFLKDQIIIAKLVITGFTFCQFVPIRQALGSPLFHQPFTTAV